jgi:hypothetical protein
MKINFPWIKSDENELEELKDILSETLTPVKARKEYTAVLRQRLIHARKSPSIAHNAESPTNLNWTVWGITALVGSILIILTGFRAIAGILGAIGVLGELGRRLKKDKAPSALFPAS